MYDSLFTQSVCGGSPSSLSLAVSIAMRISELSAGEVRLERIWLVGVLRKPL